MANISNNMSSTSNLWRTTVSPNMMQFAKKNWAVPLIFTGMGMLGGERFDNAIVHGLKEFALWELFGPWMYLPGAASLAYSGFSKGAPAARMAATSHNPHGYTHEAMRTNNAMQSKQIATSMMDYHQRAGLTGGIQGIGGEASRLHSNF